MTYQVAAPGSWANAWRNKSFWVSLANNVMIAFEDEVTENLERSREVANRKRVNGQPDFRWQAECALLQARVMT